MSSYVKDINTGVKEKRSKEQKAEIEEKLKKKWKEDSRLVKGVFKNLEAPGGDVEFAYREYKWDPPRVYRFEDGKEYEVPLGVAKHINRNTRIPVHSYILDKDGKKTNAIGQYKERYQFVSKEFM